MAVIGAPAHRDLPHRRRCDHRPRLGVRRPARGDVERAPCRRRRGRPVHDEWGAVRAPYRAARHPAPPRTWSTRTWPPSRRTRRHRIMRRGPGSATQPRHGGTHGDACHRGHEAIGHRSGHGAKARRAREDRRKTCSWAGAPLSTRLRCVPRPRSSGPRGRNVRPHHAAAKAAARPRTTGDLDATPGTTSRRAARHRAPAAAREHVTERAASVAGRLGLSPRRSASSAATAAGVADSSA